MSNYKIRVNSEVENKEVQGIFKILGGAWSEHVKADHYDKEFLYLTNGVIEYDDLLSEFLAVDECKEITLAELRDLAVLKRNDVGDATHTDPNEKESLYFRLFGDWWNLFTGGEWQQFCHMDSPRAAKLKPIEKPMKEYLRKNNDGEYILEVTDEREAQEPHAKHWIEVPKGCDYLISVFGVNSFIDSDMFAKFKTKNVLWSRKPMKEYLIKSGDGKYLLTHHDSIGAVEIPDGATYYAKDASLGKSDSFFFRLRSDDFDFEAVRVGSNWIQAIFNVENQDVLWQRDNNQTIASAVESSQPEELPFIDDECYTNKSDGGFRLPNDEPRVDIYKSEFGIEPPISLNDQYAEIETVRQSAWQKQEGGSHYKNLKIQPMQYALENKLDYAQANVVKYVTRHKEKNGKEDLLKAIHNLELMIEFYYGDEK